MRRHGIAQPYEKLKQFSRGQPMNRQTVQDFIKALELPQEAIAALLELTPANYIGNAREQAEGIILRRSNERLVTLTKDERAEVKKVARRLPVWAKRPTQINAKILTAYLRLEQTTGVPVTVAALKKKLPDIPTFDSNFVQMCVIAERNHAKVFEKKGDEVFIWPPVEDLVRELFLEKLLKLF